MSFPNQSTLQGTIRQLKEIVCDIQGEDHEAARLVSQMEELIMEIERKSLESTRAQQSPYGSRTLTPAASLPAPV